MGKGKASLHSSRTEFLSGEPNEGIEYDRGGGCFVTTKKAMFFLVLALLLLLAVVLMMYFYGPNNKENEKFDSNDLEEIIKRDESLAAEMNHRLPQNVVPLYYRLYIHPIVDQFGPKNNTFSGTVTILVHCTSKLKQIVVNAEDLQIQEVKVSSSTPKVEEMLSNTSQTNASKPANNTEKIVNPRVVTYLDIKSNDFFDDSNYIIHMASILQPGNYTIRVKFSGKISGNLMGLYKTSYLDGDGDRKWLVTTYFQPTFARRAFPCFDEPQLRAPFEISIARRTNMTTLSNMPLRETETMPNSSLWVWDHFQRTPPMPTYLVSFTVSDFVSKDSNFAAGPLFKIWAPSHLINYTNYALGVAEKMIPILEKYFDIKYPLPKLDFVTIPDFAADGVASWGLVSFRETSVYLEEGSADFEDRNLIFNEVGQELTRQWFGDLVGINWWSDVWLTDGFSIYMINLLKNELEPSWESYNHFLLWVTHPVMNEDSLKTTHSLHRVINDPQEIEYIFNDDVVKKGSCLLKMLNYTLGERIFQKGVRNFLKKRLYGSATENDFWKAFTETAKNETVLPKNITVREFMQTWTVQYGYPVVTIERKYQNHSALISQQRFIEQSDDDDDDETASWIIPLSYISKNDATVKQFWFKRNQTITEEIENVGNDSWLLFNIDQTGFYRVNYDARNWKLLQSQLEIDHEKIPIANRAQLLDDALQLSRLGLLDYNISLNLTRYLAEKETNHVPWASVQYNFKDMGLILGTGCCYGIFRNYLIDTMEGLYEKLGTNDSPQDSENDKFLRNIILKATCNAQYEPCEEWAKKEFSMWMDSENPDVKNPIPSRYRKTVLCTSLRTGGRKEWEFLWNRTLSPLISPADLKTAYLSLGCTRHAWIINRYLELSLNGNISLDNIPYVWESLVHPVGLHTGFKFLRANWERINDSYEDIFSVMKGILEKFLSKLSTEVDLQDLTTFYKREQKDLSSVASLMKSTVDEIKLRINWAEEHQKTVIEWLENNGYQY